jgi:hypothetical protein
MGRRGDSSPGIRRRRRLSGRLAGGKRGSGTVAADLLAWLGSVGVVAAAVAAEPVAEAAVGVGRLSVAGAMTARRTVGGTGLDQRIGRWDRRRLNRLAHRILALYERGQPRTNKVLCLSKGERGSLPS